MDEQERVYTQQAVDSLLDILAAVFKETLDNSVLWRLCMEDVAAASEQWVRDNSDAGPQTALIAITLHEWARRAR